MTDFYFKTAARSTQIRNYIEYMNYKPNIKNADQ